MRSLRLLVPLGVLLCASLHAAAPPVGEVRDPLPPGAIARLGHARLVGRYLVGRGYRLALHPNGRWIYSGMWFDLSTGKEIAAPVHVPEDGDVDRFFSDGSYLVSTGKGHQVFAPGSLEPRGRLHFNRGDDGFDAAGCFCLQTRESEEKQPAEVALVDLRRADPEGKSRKVLARPKDRPYGGRLSGDGARAAWLEYNQAKEQTSRCCLHDLKTPTPKVLDLPNAVNYGCLALSHDGKTVALYDGLRAHLFDFATGRRIRTVGDVPGPTCRGCAFLPDGSEVAISIDGGLLLVPVDVGKPARRLPIDFGPILPDSRRMVSQGESGVIRIYDLKTGKHLDDFSRFPQFDGVAFVGKHTAASWTVDGLLVTWDVRDGRVLREVRLRSKTIPFPSSRMMRFSPDGKYLAWEHTNLCLLAETASGKVVAEVTNNQNLPLDALFHPFRQEAAVYDRETRLCRWIDLRTGKWSRPLPELTLCDRPVALSPDGRTLLVAPAAEAVRLCESASGKPRWQEPFDPDRHHNELHGSLFLTEAFLVAGGRRVVVVRPQHVAGFDVRTGRRTLSFPLDERHRGGDRQCVMSADGRYLALVREDRAQTDPGVHLYDLEADDPARPIFAAVLPCPNPYPTALALNSDGSLLLSAHLDGTCFAWDLKKLIPPHSRKTADQEWDLLGHADPAAAQPVLAALNKDPARALKLFASRLSPALEVPPARIAGWVKGLDSADRDTRESAERRLAAARDQAEDLLLAALRNPLSLEQARRAERLLKRLDPAAEPDLLRQVRSVEILEFAGTPEALALLESLAKGAPAARLTREARDSLGRLKDRRGR